MFKSNLGLLWYRTYTSYWFVPFLMSLVGICLPYLTVQYDLELRESFFARSLAWLNFTDREVAHQLLSTIISSIINVISITFSLTMVVLTMAASQYGPQVLRNFMEDTATKFVLGTFVSTFLYCLLTLRILGSIDATAPVPFVTVALALVFTIFSVGVLVFFIHHVSRSVQVDIIVKHLSVELLEAIEKVFPSKIGETADDASAAAHWSPASEPMAISAPVGGYIQSISGDELVATAAKHDCVIEVLAKPGDFVVPGSTLAHVYRDSTLAEDELAGIGRLFVIGARRTPIQDIQYTLEKIAEIALRALSPGVNEPFVAIKCIDYLSLSLSTLTNRESPAARRADDKGKLRVVAFPVDFETVLDGAFEPVVHYAGTDASVMRAVINAVDAVWQQNRNAHHDEILAGFLDTLEVTIRQREWDAGQGDDLLAMLDRVKAANTNPTSS